VTDNTRAGHPPELTGATKDPLPESAHSLRVVAEPATDAQAPDPAAALLAEIAAWERKAAGAKERARQAEAELHHCGRVLSELRVRLRDVEV
jgi:hypothetical protein